MHTTRAPPSPLEPQTLLLAPAIVAVSVLAQAVRVIHDPPAAISLGLHRAAMRQRIEARIVVQQAMPSETAQHATTNLHIATTMARQGVTVAPVPAIPVMPASVAPVAVLVMATPMSVSELRNVSAIVARHHAVVAALVGDSRADQPQGDRACNPFTNVPVTCLRRCRCDPRHGKRRGQYKGYELAIRHFWSFLCNEPE